MKLQLVEAMQVFTNPYRMGIDIEEVDKTKSRKNRRLKYRRQTVNSFQESSILVGERGVEPPCLTAQPPQDCAYTRFRHSPDVYKSS